MARRRALPPGLRKRHGPERRIAGPARGLYDWSTDPGPRDDPQGAARRVPPLLFLGWLIAQINEAQDLFDVLADSVAHVLRTATALLLIAFLSGTMSVTARRIVLAALLGCAAGWGAAVADERATTRSSATKNAVNLGRVPETTIGDHIPIPTPGPAAGDSPRWRIVGRQALRKVNAENVPVGPSLTVDGPAHDLAVCGDSLFVTYGDAFVAKFDADSGRKLANYRYRLDRPAEEVTCGDESVFLPLAIEGTIVRLSQSDLQFETRIAVGTRTSEPIITDGHLYAADRLSNRVMEVALDTNAVTNHFDVPDDPSSLALTSTGIAVLFERSATVRLLSPGSREVKALGRVARAGRASLAAVGDLVVVAHSGSPKIELLDSLDGGCGVLEIRPAAGFSSIASRPARRNFEVVDPRGQVVVVSTEEAGGLPKTRQHCGD